MQHLGKVLIADNIGEQRAKSKEKMREKYSRQQQPAALRREPLDPGKGRPTVAPHISRKTSEIWGTADSGFKCNISERGDSCICQEDFVI
jgi:hypothetical protein